MDPNNILVFHGHVTTGGGLSHTYPTAPNVHSQFMTSSLYDLNMVDHTENTSCSNSLLWGHVFNAAKVCLLARGNVFNLMLPSNGWLLFVKLYWYHVTLISP